MAAQPPICNFGEPARPFELLATDGKRYGLEDVRGPKGLLVMFICNHCPYVKSVLDRIIRDVKDLEALTSTQAASGQMDLFRTCATYEEFKEKSEKLFLQQRLQDNDWNVKRTAEGLGMQRSNLYKKMERYGLK